MLPGLAIRLRPPPRGAPFNPLRGALAPMARRLASRTGTLGGGLALWEKVAIPREDRPEHGGKGVSGIHPV